MPEEIHLQIEKKIIFIGRGNLACHIDIAFIDAGFFQNRKSFLQIREELM